MNSRAFFFLLPGGAAAGLAASLVDAGMKTGILLILATLAVIALGKSSAATRHVVWTAAVVCAIAMPILSLCLPQWRVLPTWMAPHSAARNAGLAALLPPPQQPPSKGQVPHTREAPAETSPVRSASAPPTSGSPIHAVPAMGIQTTGSAFSRATGLLLGWAIGAALLLLPLLRSAWSLHRLSRRSHIVANGVLAETLREVAHELRLRRNVSIHTGSADAMPMVWGIWRARLLLPSSAEQWPAERLRAVMLHELAHIRRRDPLTLLVAHLARAIHWFNPLAWLAVHRLRVEQEQACDDYVLRAGVKPSDYATDVLEIATILRAPHATGAMALSMADPARLESRLRLIVHEACNRTALARWFVAVASIATTAIALPLAMLRAADNNPEAQSVGDAKVPAQQTDAPGFGPVIERVVNDVEETENQLLDMDTGEVSSITSEIRTGQMTPEALADWIRSQGTDLYFKAEVEGSGIGGVGLSLVGVDDDQWENGTPGILRQELRNGHPGLRTVESLGMRYYLLPRQPNIPSTFAFQTSGGGTGLLQLTGLAEKPRGVKIRYKLVRTRREFAPLQQTALASIAFGKRFLSLDDGELHATAPVDELIAYLERDGKGRWSLIVEGLHNYHTERETGLKFWETMSPDEISQPAGLAALPFERKRFYPLGSRDLPSVVLIPQWGLLRIAAFDDQTSSVILEYKRVAAEGQRDAGKPSGERPTSRSESTEVEPGRSRLQQTEAKGAAQLDLDETGSKKALDKREPAAPNKGHEHTAQIGAQQLGAEDARLQKLQAEAQSNEYELDQAKLAVMLRAAELKGDAAEAARVRLRQAESELAMRTKLHAQRALSDQELNEGKLKVTLRAAELKGDEAELARLTKLHAQKIVSDQELAEAKLMVDLRAAELKGDPIALAEWRVRQAEPNLEVAAKLYDAKAASHESLDEAKSNLELRRAELKRAKDTAAPGDRPPDAAHLQGTDSTAASEPKIGGGTSLPDQLRPSKAEAAVKSLQRSLMAKQNGADPRALPVVASDKGELSGRVVDRHGKPVADVLVDAWDWHPGNETRTGADGTFRLTRLDPDHRVQVRFIRSGFAPHTVIKQPLGAMTAPVVLDDETYFEGIVAAPDGTPVPDAFIRANQGPKEADGVHISTIWTETHSNAQGRYRLLVQDDTYDLQVTSPAGLVARLPKVAIAREKAVPLDLRLEPGVVFRAKILDSQTGEGVAGIRLNHWQHPGLEGTTNAQGELEIRGLIPGPFEFEVKANGYARWWSEECSQPSDRRTIRDNGWQRNFDHLHFDLTSNMAPVTITLEKAVQIRGWVVDPDGNRVAGATAAPALTGTGNSLTGDTRFSVTTKDDGSFEMFLPASGDGSYNLIAHDGGYQEWRKWANGVSEPLMKTTPGEQIESFELKLNRPASVRGRVLDSAGRPVMDRAVRASAADLRDNRYYDPTTRTDAEGRFEIKFIRPGKHIVQVAPFWLHPNNASANASHAVNLGESETVEIPNLTAPEAS